MLNVLVGVEYESIMLPANEKSLDEGIFFVAAYVHVAVDACVEVSCTVSPVPEHVHPEVGMLSQTWVAVLYDVPLGQLGVADFTVIGPHAMPPPVHFVPTKGI